MWPLHDPVDAALVQARLANIGSVMAAGSWPLVCENLDCRQFLNGNPDR